MRTSSSPRVLLVTGEYPPAMGGVGDYTALLAKHLQAQGVEVQILAGSMEAAPIAVDGEPKVLRMVKKWDLSCWRKVAEVARTGSNDTVHIQYQSAAYGLRGEVNLLPGYLRRALPRVRVVTTFHDLRVPYLFPKAGPLRRAAVSAMDRLSHATVVTNGADLEQLGGRGTAEGGRPRRWLIPLASSIPNSVPADFDRSLWRASRFSAVDSTLVLAYFGFMNDSKGVDTLSDAFAMIRYRGVAAKLVLIGGETGESDPTNRGCADRVRKSIQSAGVADEVIWTGFSSASEVSGHLCAADVCVLPFRDGASLRRSSLLTAVEHGLPILTTHPERPEPLLRDRGNVVMVRPNDPKALADAAEFLWHDEPSRIRLSAAALDLAARFRWTDISEEHIRMYRAVLGMAD